MKLYAMHRKSLEEEPQVLWMRSVTYGRPWRNPRSREGPILLYTDTGARGHTPRGAAILWVSRDTDHRAPLGQRPTRIKNAPVHHQPPLLSAMSGSRGFSTGFSRDFRHATLLSGQITWMTVSTESWNLCFSFITTNLKLPKIRPAEEHESAKLTACPLHLAEQLADL